MSQEAVAREIKVNLRSLYISIFSQDITVDH